MATTARFLEEQHVVNSIVPVADFIASNKTTDEVCMSRWNHCTWLVVTGANGSAHDMKFTVNSCSTIAAGNTTAIPFDYTYSLGDSLTSRNTWADYTRVAAAGIMSVTAATNSAANRMFCIDIDADMLSVTSNVQHEYASLTLTESGGDAITGCVITILSDPRFATDGGDHVDETV